MNQDAADIQRLEDERYAAMGSAMIKSVERAAG